MRSIKVRTVAGAVACVFVFGGCDQVREYLGQEAPVVPDADAVAVHYADYHGVKDVTVSGNVVVVTVEQPFQQLDRGGSLWARVGPFVYLMTPSTRALFEEFPAIAAVRVVTVLPNGEEVARAMLRRDAMSETRWRRTLNILGHALQDGQENPRKLEELTEWGEQRTEFSYNPEYVN